MSKFAIDDILVAKESNNQGSLRDLNNRELKLTGGSSAGASSAADRDDALAASGATTDGYVYARAEGSSYYSYYDPYYGYSSSSSYGPTATVDASDRYNYPYYY